MRHTPAIRRQIGVDAMTASERASLEAMFKAFAPAHCERWSYLLTRKPARWNKITPMLAWPVPSPFDSFPDKPFDELLASPPLSRYGATPSVVLHCGHSSSPRVQTLPLAEAFPNGECLCIVFEGFISIVSGMLAMGFSHEGGVCIYGSG